MNIRRLFSSRHKGDSEPTHDAEPVPLRIEGVPDAPLTAEPDDAELAAQALLEAMAEVDARADLKSDRNEYKDLKSGKKRIANADIHSDGIANPAEQRTPNLKPQTSNLKPEVHDAAYFRHLAAKIRQARQSQRLRTLRFVAFCEQELKKRHLPAYGDGLLGLLEAELLKRLDVIEREGGDLKRRWQHCLATVTVRLMQAQAAGATAPNEPRDGEIPSTPGVNEGD